MLPRVVRPEVRVLGNGFVSLTAYQAGAEFQRCSAHAYQPKMWMTPLFSRWSSCHATSLGPVRSMTILAIWMRDDWRRLPPEAARPHGMWHENAISHPP